MYAAFDNNGVLICLTTNREYAIETADCHFKDTAELPIDEDLFPSDALVCDGNGKDLGTLAELQRPITLPEAINFYPIAYSTLAQAAREGRIEAEQHGKIWFTTRAAIEQAIEEGKLKPRHKDS